MKKRFLLDILLLTAFNCFASNNIYMPWDIENIYNGETRSYSGKPGPAYWQNSSNYDMDVNFNPKDGTVKGKARIVYYNNSPNELDYLVLRLYQDHFKKGNVRDKAVLTADLHDGVKIISLSVEKDSSKNTFRNGTNMFLYLNSILKPGDSLIVHVQWEFRLPQYENGRFGKYNGGWFVALWYPQISVYDDIEGWDINNFGWTQEFYNDFNNYRINITAPKNFVVDATGTLLNPEATLGNDVYGRYKMAHETDSVIKIISSQDILFNKTTQKRKNITWSFGASHVTDFAFCVSDKYVWDGRSVELGNDKNKKRVFVSALYNPKSKDFYEVAHLAAGSVKFLSEEMPGIIYPYPKMTVFNGAIGGMEYPMIVNNASSKKRDFTVILTSHEIAHTYFPFLTGINERKYSWMDEGWAEMLPLDWQNLTETGTDFIEEMVLMYETYAGKEEEIPPMFPTNIYNSNGIVSYRIMSYYRAGTAYYILKDLLGEELFKKALKEYIKRWQGKHPLPYDFFFTFDEVAGENLSWFWKPWFYDFGYPDLAIKDVMKEEGQIVVKIDKEGNIPAPLFIKVIHDDGSEQDLYFNAGIWKSSNAFTYTLTTEKEVKMVTINNKHIPDVNKGNNTFIF